MRCPWSVSVLYSSGTSGEVSVHPLHLAQDLPLVPGQNRAVIQHLLEHSSTLKLITGPLEVVPVVSLLAELFFKVSQCETVCVHPPPIGYLLTTEEVGYLCLTTHGWSNMAACCHLLQPVGLSQFFCLERSSRAGARTRGECRAEGGWHWTGPRGG